MQGVSSILLIGAGYVGSRLAAELRLNGHNVTTVDTQDAPSPHINARYQALSAEDLRPFGSILWFAGHTSVREATADPTGALRNNMSDLWELRSRLRPDQRFIYASSASVYNMARPEICSESFQPRALLNVYDQTKAWFDTLMTTSNRPFWGLRLGTIAGASARLRTDTVFNAMTLSAHRTGIVHLRNEDVHRGVLGLPDLVRAVEAVVVGNVSPGLYNLASFNTTMGTLANTIASHFGAKVKVEPPTLGYNFRMSCAKFESDALFRFQDTISNLANEIVAVHGRVPA